MKCVLFVRPVDLPAHWSVYRPGWWFSLWVSSKSVLILAPFLRELICSALLGGELDHWYPLLPMIHVEMSQWKIHLLIVTYFCHLHWRCAYLSEAICPPSRNSCSVAILTPEPIGSLRIFSYLDLPINYSVVHIILLDWALKARGRVWLCVTLSTSWPTITDEDSRLLRRNFK